MNQPDRLEFYTGSGLVAVLDSSIVPPVGSFVNIRKITYEVKAVSYAVDYVDERSARYMRANIDLVEVVKNKRVKKA